MEACMIHSFKRKSAHTVMCAALLLVFAACTGCNISGPAGSIPGIADSIAIMTWNVHNLFDGVEDGTEYVEFLPSEGWTDEKYRGRLNVFAGVIGQMEQKPDIIALQEVESALVIADLAAALANQGHRYGWTYFSRIPGMATGLGLLSRFPLEEVRSHSIYADGDSAPRPMLEVRLNRPNPPAEGDAPDEGGPLVLFVCHWKSKVGGEDATESTRRASARIILRRIRELMADEPDTPFIIMGDLNENHDGFYRRSGAVITALLPDDPRAAEFTGLYGFDENRPDAATVIAGLQSDFLIISKDRPPVPRYFPAGVVVLFSPWAQAEGGSYYYRNAWETIDHFLLSAHWFTAEGWDYDSFRVLNEPPFASINGLPMPYSTRTGNGLSDHLPLMLFLRRRDG